MVNDRCSIGRSADVATRTFLPVLPAVSVEDLLCLNCRHCEIVLDPGGDSRSPCCSHEEHPRTLAPLAPACPDFRHKLLNAAEAALLLSSNQEVVRTLAEAWQHGRQGLPTVTISGELWFERQVIEAYKASGESSAQEVGGTALDSL